MSNLFINKFFDDKNVISLYNQTFFQQRIDGTIDTKLAIEYGKKWANENEVKKIVNKCKNISKFLNFFCISKKNCFFCFL